jgi:hypothetical protein
MSIENDLFKQALYHRISNAAKEAVSKKFAAELGKTGSLAKGGKLNNRRQREITARMKTEIRGIVIKEFDYDIPMVSFEKAAEGLTYGLDENHLSEIAAEYTAYRKQNKLWKPQDIPIG